VEKYSVMEEGEISEGFGTGRRLAPGQTSLTSFGVLMKAVRPDFQFSFA